MNILFTLYGDFSSNSANPMALYARTLSQLGHSCAVAVPSGLDTVDLHDEPAFVPVLFDAALDSPESIFPDGRPADVIHACTPRESVRRFVTSYMVERPTPLVMALEDNEAWISTRALGLNEATLYRHTQQEISERLPDALSHPFYHDSFTGLADAAVVIQDKLRTEVPPWVHCETVMIGIDVELFSPRPSDPVLREQFGVARDEKVIVYHGGMNQFTRPALETLCRAVGLINRRGHPCRLLRSGPMALDFLQDMPGETASAISDLGVLEKEQLPDLLALADVFVQPGRNDAFEDLRLPGKVPEFLAMGRPVIIPDTNIAELFTSGVDAVVLRSDGAEEIAGECISLFTDISRAERIGRAGRVVAEKYFDSRKQAGRLECVYEAACRRFRLDIASKVWRNKDGDDSVNLMLARKLRLLAGGSATDSNLDARPMLTEHARQIEIMQRRVEGLEERRGSYPDVASIMRVLAESDNRLVSILYSTGTMMAGVLRWVNRQIKELLQLLGGRT